MNFKNQISITADSGVGSTTTSKKLLEYFGYSPYRWVNAGAIMRSFAKELGISIEEFAKHTLNTPHEKYDERCDDEIRRFGEHDYVIFEGRLVHHFAPHAFHVLLKCDPLIRAKRRAKDFPGVNESDLLDMIDKRDKANRERYSKIYGPEVLWDESKFDLVIDTGVSTPEEIVFKIVEGHKNWSKNK